MADTDDAVKAAAKRASEQLAWHKSAAQKLAADKPTTDDALRRELAALIGTCDGGFELNWEFRMADALLAGPVAKHTAALEDEIKRLKNEADGEYVRAACEVMRAHPAFEGRDYSDGITADDFREFFAEDINEAWRASEKAEARIAELEKEREADKSCIAADGIQISYLRATISNLEAENTRLLKAMTEA